MIDTQPHIVFKTPPRKSDASDYFPSILVAQTLQVPAQIDLSREVEVKRSTDPATTPVSRLQFHATPLTVVLFPALCQVSSYPILSERLRINAGLSFLSHNLISTGARSSRL
jgi:hypothetical protein